jgi:hypothetical protein
MSVKPNLSTSSLVVKLTGAGQRLRPYRLPFFLLFIALLYGFLLLRISDLANMQPSQDTVTSQVKAAKLPRIDPTVVKQLHSLQDNSVNVQSLFDQARNNPFQ